MASPIVEDLNDAQRQAVTIPPGPVLVLAGPGSGKTSVLTRRIAYLIETLGVRPERLMALTFTNKAAREMRDRVQRLLGQKVSGTKLGTFHSTCAWILRREAERYLPITRDYVIFDTSDQRALMKIVITEDLQLDEKRYRPDRILNAISAAKNDLVMPDQYRSNSYFEEITKRAYQHYQDRLAINNAVDFDDLLMHTALILDTHPDALVRYQNAYDHILVDEFQDTNGAQYRLLKLFATKHEHLFCVGDEDQSIYAWRGADYRNMQRLRTDFPGLTTILLEQNYRSTQIILDAAGAVIDKNQQRTPKKLFTDREGGAQIMLYEAHNEQYEAQFVVDTIAALTMESEVEPGECAIMYRTNAQSRVLEEAFVRANVPYRLVGATRFYGRREIKDVMAYLRIIHNPDDRISLQRIINVPTRGIGDKTYESLEVWAGQQNITMGEALLRLAQDPEAGPFSGRARSALVGFAEMVAGWQSLATNITIADLLKVILDETAYLAFIDDGTEQGADRRANVNELINLAAEFEELPLTTFLEEIALVSDQDTLVDGVNAPSLMTLHAAKGLEFDAVFIIGLEEGVLPHDRSKDDPEQMAEERRLMYVGITRARRYLFLVYAFRRSQWGESNLNLRSRFIDDIPEDLLAHAHVGSVGYGAPPRVGRRSRPPRLDDGSGLRRQGMIYSVGQRVSHAKFGEGIVMDCRPSGDDQEVSIIFDSVGVKRLLVSFANLTVLEN